MACCLPYLKPVPICCVLPSTLIVLSMSESGIFSCMLHVRPQTNLCCLLGLQVCFLNFTDLGVNSVSFWNITAIYLCVLCYSVTLWKNAVHMQSSLQDHRGLDSLHTIICINIVMFLCYFNDLSKYIFFQQKPSSGDRPWRVGELWGNPVWSRADRLLAQGTEGFRSPLRYMHAVALWGGRVRIITKDH